MEKIVTITVNRGSLLSTAYKGSTVMSTNLDLVGTELISAPGRVYKYVGNVVDKATKTIVGNFSYRNGDVNPMSPMPGYESVVKISDEKYANLQEEATGTLLAGVAKFSELTSSTISE